MQPPFLWRDGIQIDGTPVWCDATRRRDLCFWSHAKRALVGPHGQLLCTPRTLRLLSLASPGPHGKRAKAPPDEPLLTPFSRPFCLGSLRLELFPSGLLPGAASLLCSLDHDRHPLVYASEVNPQAGPLSEPMQVRAAEAVCLAAPLAALGLPLPGREEAEAVLLGCLAQAREAGAVALVVAPSPGTAEEVVRLLCQHGTIVHAQRNIHERLLAYADLGLTPFPPGNPPRPLGEGGHRWAQPGEAIVWPLDRPFPAPGRLGGLLGPDRLPPRTYLCTGAALSPEAVARYEKQLPAGVPLSGAVPYPDGLDLPGLLRYVADTGARDVYLTAGCSEAVARALSARRVRLHPLGPPDQLDLFSADVR